jgi:coat protein Gp5
MANVLATSSIVAKKALAILENNLMFGSNVNRKWEDEYTGNMTRGYATGATINIKLPSRYTYRAGRVSVPQASVDTTIPLTLSQGGTDIAFTSFERTVGITEDSLEEKVMAAMAAVINEVDFQGLQMANFATFNTLNVSGALPATQQTAVSVYTDAGRRLNEMAAPLKGSRSFVMGPALNGASVAGLSGLFNAQDKISKQYGNGIMVDALGFNVGLDQNIAVQTNGAATATNIAGAGQTGSSITVAAVAGGTLTRGTAITLPGVFAVNPQNRQSTGVLADFIVTADVAQGATVIPISPAIVTSGAFQNVTASPTNTTPYVIKGAASTAYQSNIAFDKDAFTLAMVPMEMPKPGTGAVAHQESHNGFTVKVTDYYDGVNDITNTRIDVLFGWAATYPQLAARYYTLGT